MDRHGLRPRDDEGVPAPRDDEGVPASRDDEGVPTSRDDEGVPASRDDEGVPAPRDDEGVPTSRDDEGICHCDCRVALLLAVTKNPVIASAARQSQTAVQQSASKQT